MGTTVSTISRWFDNGVEKGASYMLVVCDTYDYEDYPVYCYGDEQTWKIYNNPGQMQKVMEVYSLYSDKNEQLIAGRVFNLPPKQ